MTVTKELVPAAELAAKASKPYPGDSDQYRKARTALLTEEIELRRHIARVAAQRRELPLGGEARAYEFLDENGKTVSLADMFGAHDTLVTYFWMYGPERQRPCPMCTCLIGSLDTPARDLHERVGMAVIGRSPVARQLAFARERGWTNLNFYQCVGDDFAKDYRGLAEDGSEWPALDVWVRRGAQGPSFLGGRIRRNAGSRAGSTRLARPHTALDRPRPDSRRTRHRLVPEAGVWAVRAAAP